MPAGAHAKGSNKAHVLAGMYANFLVRVSACTCTFARWYACACALSRACTAGGACSPIFCRPERAHADAATTGGAPALATRKRARARAHTGMSACDVAHT
eukprot:5407239-Pleurochrysis_carterae.AAC.1